MNSFDDEMLDPISSVILNNFKFVPFLVIASQMVNLKWQEILQSKWITYTIRFWPN